MCISSVVYRYIKEYDETLFVDMVDYWLMDKLKEININKVTVIPCKIYQEFSGTVYKDRDKVLQRYKIYKRDFSTYCRKTGKSELFCFFMLLKRRIRIELSLLTG